MTEDERMTQIQLLRKYDIHPVKRFGQNFLIDENIQRNIVSRLPTGRGLTFLEIGPGMGAITLPLLEMGERVTAIEIDKKLQVLLETELEEYWEKGLHLIKDDALLVLTDENLRKELKGDAVLIGNLPYAISTPLLFKLLELEHFFLGGFVMLQKEVVDRLLAKPGSKNYGRLSASFGMFAKVKKLFDVPAGCFSPKPDIVSSFVSIEFKQKKIPKEDREAYFHLVKVAFSERRKQLAGLLTRGFGLKTREAEDFMVRTGFSPNVRAEQLDSVSLWKLLEHIRKHSNSSP